MKLKSSTLAKLAAAAGGLGLVAVAAVTQLGARNDSLPAFPGTPVVVPIEEPCVLLPDPEDPICGLPQFELPPGVLAVPDPCPGCGLG